MTNKPPRMVLADGTKVYDCYTRYRPLDPDQRKIGVRKPDDPRALRFYGNWYLPLDLLPDADRILPETRDDRECLRHKLGCICQVCKRPQARVWWKRARKREIRF
jgi:hypothetical protein